MDYIEKIKKQKKEIARTEKVLELYPDIKEKIDRWSNKRLSSPSINSKTDRVHINHNCGCCEDSILQAWPYKIVNGIEVFSDPACFVIGEKIPFYYGLGERSYDNWQEELRKENITETVINQIQKFFDDNKPQHIEYVDD